jgi:hypothetical protein
MQTAKNQFSHNIQYVRELQVLYQSLKEEQQLPNDLSDLLRAEIVYVVSALDKLVHELVRIGMLQVFTGNRPKTKSFERFTISNKTLDKIIETSLERKANPSRPPLADEELPSYWFEQEIVLKNKHFSYQEPKMIAEGLGLIWQEEYKWQKIGLRMAMTEQEVKETLNPIVSRRNQIVHEADINLQTGLKNEILDTDTKDIVDFIEKLGNAIYNCVKI